MTLDEETDVFFGSVELSRLLFGWVAFSACEDFSVNDFLCFLVFRNIEHLKKQVSLKNGS